MRVCDEHIFAHVTQSHQHPFSSLNAQLSGHLFVEFKDEYEPIRPKWIILQRSLWSRAWAEAFMSRACLPASCWIQKNHRAFFLWQRFCRYMLIWFLFCTFFHSFSLLHQIKIINLKYSLKSSPQKNSPWKTRDLGAMTAFLDISFLEWI